MQVNKDNFHKNGKIVDHNYNVKNKIMQKNHSAYKYETPYKGSFFITQCWTNGAGALQCGAIKIRCNISCIKSYTSDAYVKDINPETDDF